MSEQTIYLLMACVDYEGSSPVLAFSEKKVAEQWKEIATDWLAKAPVCDYQLDDDEDIEQWEIQQESWQSEQPKLKDASYADYFRISEIEVVVTVS